MDINQRATELRAHPTSLRDTSRLTHRRESREGEVSSEHEYSIKALAALFVRWAVQNHVPYNYEGTYRHRHTRQARITPRGWVIARYIEEDGKGTNVIVVNCWGELIRIYNPRSSFGFESVTEYDPIDTEVVLEHIARFVAKYNIPW